MHNHLDEVPARRHPHQVFIAGLLMVSGVSILLGGPRPGSVDAALPTPLLLLWAGVLTIGGALVVLAAVVPPLMALFFELAADLPLAVMCLVYSQAAWLLAGGRAAFPVALAAAASAAFAFRGWQSFRKLRAVRRVAPAQ